MTETPRTPRTLAEFEQLEAQVHVPFDQLTFSEPPPLPEPVRKDYDTKVQTLLFESPG